MKLFILTVSVSLLTPLFASAASDPSKTSDIDQILAREESCLKTAISNTDMKVCAGNAFTEADALLNEVYRTLSEPLKKSTDKTEREILRRLVNSESTWIKFRDANCDYQGSVDLGGSQESLDILGCLGDMTVARIKELRK